MIEWGITAAAGWHFPQGEEVDGVAAVAARWPSRRTRRMSSLGILLTALVEEAPPPVDASVIYATTYSEAIALEHYLESLPDASPTNFQTSIHPGGIEQALIAAGCPVRALFPLAGTGHLVSQTLHMAALTSSEATQVAFGEEKGTWLETLGVASAVTFAGMLRMTKTGDGSAGRFAYSPEENRDLPGREPSSEEFVRSLIDRRDLVWRSVFGSFILEWRRQ